MRIEIRKLRGFGILELMVVLGIIALLAAISVPAYRSYTSNAQASEIVLLFDELRTGLQADFQQGAVNECNLIQSRAGGAGPLTNHYAAVSIGFNAEGAGYKPVLLVNADLGRDGALGIGVANAALEEFQGLNRVAPGSVVSDNLVSFAVPLSDTQGPDCLVAVSSGANPNTAGTANSAQTSSATAQLQTAAPAVSQVDLMRVITGATALSAYAGSPQGVPLGTTVVGLYMAGSSVNELASVAPGQLPSVSAGYVKVADAGYQYLDQSGALGRLMPTRQSDLVALPPDQRNAWDGGIVVFSNGAVGRMQKAANGSNGGEKDYIYFSVLEGVNANEGMAIVHGTAAPGETVQVSRGGTVLGTVTADAQGNWNLAGAAALSSGSEPITVDPAP